MLKTLKFPAVICTLAILTGCASVSMAPKEESIIAKQFQTPEKGYAGIYIFRKDSPVGAGLKKDIWINGECVGESARGVFFYHQVEGDKRHEVATESEFSPNITAVMAKSGENYFIEQYLKIGVFVGGANLRQVDKDVGMKEVRKLEMAEKGSCS